MKGTFTGEDVEACSEQIVESLRYREILSQQGGNSFNKIITNCAGGSIVSLFS